MSDRASDINVGRAYGPLPAVLAFDAVAGLGDLAGGDWAGLGNGHPLRVEVYPGADAHVPRDGSADGHWLHTSLDQADTVDIRMKGSGAEFFSGRHKSLPTFEGLDSDLRAGQIDQETHDRVAAR